MLDAILHQPIRTRMVAYLVGRGEATFTEIKQAVEITDGNLDAHMKKLIAAGYVASRREASEGHSQTFYALTGLGVAAFKAYVKSLQSILGLAPAGRRRSR